MTVQNLQRLFGSLTEGLLQDGRYAVADDQYHDPIEGVPGCLVQQHLAQMVA